MIMKGITVYLFAAALALSGIAAYYSIVGLAAIFSSAFWPVVLMAGTLEISKLIVASWLYHKWDTIPMLLKTYLTTAVVVLMMITSLGIFGFLSKAHVDQNLVNTSVTLQISQLDTQIVSAQTTVTRLETQLQQLDRSIDIQLNANRAAQAQTARRSQQAEREQIRTALDQQTQQLLTLTQQRTTLMQQASVQDSKLGPIRYVAEIFSSGDQLSQETAVRWMIIVLVLVFDPLAVLMIIAANISVKHNMQGQQPSHKPGDIRWDPINNAFVCWNGDAWQSLNTTSSASVQSEVNTDAITDIVSTTMNQWLKEALSVTPTVDPDNIRTVVEHAINDGINRIVQAVDKKSPSAAST